MKTPFRPRALLVLAQSDLVEARALQSCSLALLVSVLARRCVPRLLAVRVICELFVVLLFR